MTSGYIIEAVFSIGSNFGDRESNVADGIRWLSGIVSDIKSSAIYSTPDCHGSEREYFNAVARGYTAASTQELEKLCKEYEARCGRNEEKRKAGIVPIDIDLIVYSGKILRPKDFRRKFFRIGYETLYDHHRETYGSPEGNVSI